MHNIVHVFKVTCPECGSVHFGFVGNDEDGSFYCNAMVEIRKGNKTTTEKCGYFIEKMRHIPENSYELIKTIEITDIVPKE